MSLNQNQSANRQVITVIKPLHVWLTLTNITPCMFYLHTEYCIDPSNYTLSSGQNQNYLFENGGVRFLYGPF